MSSCTNGKIFEICSMFQSKLRMQPPKWCKSLGKVKWLCFLANLGGNFINFRIIGLSVRFIGLSVRFFVSMKRIIAQDPLLCQWHEFSNGGMCTGAYVRYRLL